MNRDLVGEALRAMEEHYRVTGRHPTTLRIPYSLTADFYKDAEIYCVFPTEEKNEKGENILVRRFNGAVVVPYSGHIIAAASRRPDQPQDWYARLREAWGRR